MSEERMRVLEMIREGKISAEEGARLLEALKGAGEEERPHWRRGRHDRGEDDPIGTFVGMVTDAVHSGGFGGLRGWRRGWRGGWHFGPLAGQERRREREQEGWQFQSFSDGDHGTFEIPQGSRLIVESEAGSIEATAGDGAPRLDLEGEAYDFAVYVARKDDRVIVAAYRTSHDAKMPRLKVSVPRSVPRVEMRTAGGSVRASSFGCPLELRTAGGGIRVNEHGEGELELRTAGGGIEVDGRPSRATMHTAGGGIQFRGATNAFEAKTAGGSITIDGARLTSGDHRAATAGGSVRVTLTPDSSVAIRARTTGGNINVDLPGAKGEMSGSRISPKYDGEFNGGAARLSLSTVGGSVSVGLAAGSERTGTSEAA